MSKSILSCVFMFLVVVPFVLLAYGFDVHPLIHSLPWSNGGAARYVLSVSLIFLSLFVLSKKLNKGAYFIGSALLLVAAFLLGSLWPLIAVLLIVFCSLVLGHFICRNLKLDFKTDVFSNLFLTGIGFYGTVIGLLAHTHLNYFGIYGVILLAPILLFHKDTISVWLLATDLWKSFLVVRKEDSFIDLLIITLALIYFLVSLFPEVGYDALAVHLVVLTHLKTMHTWSFDPSLYSLALVPMLGDWVFSLGYLLADEAGARLTNLCFTYLLAWQAFQLAKWMGAEDNAAKFAALLVLSSPLVFAEASSLFVEGVWAAFCIAAIFAVCRALFDDIGAQSHKEIMLAGLLMGLALATKAISFYLVACLAPLLLFASKSFLTKEVWGSWFLAGVFVIVLGGIPYLNAYLLSGNPVFPFFNQVFKSSFYPLVNFDNPFFKSGLTWDFAYQSVFASSRYMESSNGAGGFQWLLLFPVAISLLILRRNLKSLTLSLYCLLCIYLVFNSQSYLRYIYPFYVAMCAVVAVGIFESTKAHVIVSKVLLAGAVVTIALNLFFLASASYSYRSFPVSVLKSELARQTYIYNAVPIRQAIDLVNVLNQKHERVALITQDVFAAELKGDALYSNWYNFQFEKAISSVSNPETMLEVFKRFKTHIIILDHSWGKKAELIEIISKNTILVADLGRFSVRVLRDIPITYGAEILLNSDFSSLEAWSVSSGAVVVASEKKVIVNVAEPVTQAVSVAGQKNYLNEVTAQCDKATTQGRVQINWLDANQKFLEASIQVFECTKEWATYRQEVVSPEAAVTAVVYATSHTTDKIQINRVSLK